MCSTQHLEHHFLREHSGNPDLETPPRTAASPLALARPLRQRRGALPGNSHRVTANFPGKLLGFLLAPVTEVAAKSAAGVLAAAVGPPGAGAAARALGVLPERSRAEVQNSLPAQARLAAPPGTLRQPPRLSPSPAPEVMELFQPARPGGRLGKSRGRFLRVRGLAAAGARAHARTHTHVCVGAPASVCVCHSRRRARVCVCVCLRTERAGWENNGEPLGTERQAPSPHPRLPPPRQDSLCGEIRMRRFTSGSKGGRWGVGRRRLGWEVGRGETGAAGAENKQDAAPGGSAGVRT